MAVGHSVVSRQEGYQSGENTHVDRIGNHEHIVCVVIFEPLSERIGIVRIKIPVVGSLVQGRGRGFQNRCGFTGSIGVRSRHRESLCSDRDHQKIYIGIIDKIADGAGIGVKNRLTVELVDIRTVHDHLGHVIGICEGAGIRMDDSGGFKVFARGSDFVPDSGFQNVCTVVIDKNMVHDAFIQTDKIGNLGDIDMQIQKFQGRIV